MKSLRWVEGIGAVDRCGEVYDKYPYEGAKGFKISKDERHKYIYSLEKQQKLFSIPKNVRVEENEKAIVIPIKYVIHYLGKQERLTIDNDFLGVFDTAGKLIGYGRKVELEENYFKMLDKENLWGLYTYDGNEIFSQKN